MTSLRKFMWTMTGYAGGESTSHMVMRRPCPTQVNVLSRVPLLRTKHVHTSETVQNCGYHYSRCVIYGEVSPAGANICEIKHLR